MTKTVYTYPLEPPTLTPAHLLADPPARTPVVDRQTIITIRSDGVVVLDTNDPNVVRLIAKSIAQGEDSWVPVRIEGANGRQTHWVLEGDESLISIRGRKFKRPGIIENLKKEKAGKETPADTPPAPRDQWDGFVF